MIAFEGARCVRARAVAATCRACVDACPTGAVTLDGLDVAVAASACVDCGACGAACPTAAFPAPAAEARPALRCGDGVACVGALSVEALLPLAKGGLRVLVGAAECPAHAAHARVAERLRAVRALIGAEVLFDDEPARPVSDRRRWLAGLVRGGDDARLDRAALDPAALRRREVPARRAATLAALGPATAEVPAADAPFTSRKRLDTATCTGCFRCVAVCPTGALTTSALRDALRFEAAACVACGLCHDVCEPGALSRGDAVALGELGRAVVLGALRMRPCGECGAWFNATDDGGLCPRCLALDDEAVDLLGWKR